mmetsp:Transcript_41984/g.136225  ORF Transcript_41984/g.136225 Transcript_41984/m.136225 type:complete len:220 (-) Transcript_41984:159-818(-)
MRRSGKRKQRGRVRRRADGRGWPAVALGRGRQAPWGRRRLTGRRRWRGGSRGAAAAALSRAGEAEAAAGRGPPQLRRRWRRARRRPAQRRAAAGLPLAAWRAEGPNSPSPRRELRAAARRTRRAARASTRGRACLRGYTTLEAAPLLRRPQGRWLARRRLAPARTLRRRAARAPRAGPRRAERSRTLLPRRLQRRPPHGRWRALSPLVRTPPPPPQQQL